MSQGELCSVVLCYISMQCVLFVVCVCVRERERERERESVCVCVCVSAYVCVFVCMCVYVCECVCVCLFGYISSSASVGVCHLHSQPTKYLHSARLMLVDHIHSLPVGRTQPLGLELVLHPGMAVHVHLRVVTMLVINGSYIELTTSGSIVTASTENVTTTCCTLNNNPKLVDPVAKRYSSLQTCPRT